MTLSEFNKIIKFYLIILITLTIVINISGGNRIFDNQKSNNDEEKILNSISFDISNSFQILHDPISIDGNIEFHNKALIEGWKGNGSMYDPYFISNYSINTLGEPGIQIKNTTVYFNIENVTLTGSINNLTGAIHLINVTNGYFKNNIASNNTNGIFLNLAYNNTFTENTIFNNKYGIYLGSSSNNNLFTKNNVSMNNRCFWLSYSDFNNINSNIFINNNDGIKLSASNNNIFSENTVANNNIDGFSLTLSCQNEFRNNFINNNTFSGFYINVESNYNKFESNNIYNSGQHGISLRGNSISNYIYLNTFIENNNGTFYLSNNGSQAYSSNENIWNNGTHGNYWSDYSGYDENGDGIGDNPYIIEGEGDNTDPYPMKPNLEYEEPNKTPLFLVPLTLLSLMVLVVITKKTD